MALSAFQSASAFSRPDKAVADVSKWRGFDSLTALGITAWRRLSGNGGERPLIRGGRIEPAAKRDRHAGKEMQDQHGDDGFANRKLVESHGGASVADEKQLSRAKRARSR